MFGEERYSYCIVHVSDAGDRSYFKYYRVADYDPFDDDEELAPAMLAMHARDLEQAQANPDHLYNPSAVYNHHDRDSDFFLFRWRDDPDNPNNKITGSIYDYDNFDLRDMPLPCEVIFLSRFGEEDDLRIALEEGVSFQGRTTNPFYLVYAREGDDFIAAKCDRDDFVFDGAFLMLKDRRANSKNAALTVPKVLLEGYSIIESPHKDTGYRRIYGKLGPAEEIGSVPLRPISCYASDYLRWIMDNSSTALTDKERASVFDFIESALSFPEALELYLDTAPSEKEVDQLKKAVIRCANEEGGYALDCLKNYLIADDSIFELCVDGVIKRDDDLRELIEGQRQAINESEKLLDEISREHASLEATVKARREELDALKLEKETVLSELEANIALKIGLRTVSAASKEAAPSASLACIESREGGNRKEGLSLVEAVSENMKRLGVGSVLSDSSGERNFASYGLIAAFAATRVVACSQPVASIIADALSYAIDGKSAKKMFVPADYQNFEELAAILQEPKSVFVFDGVLDSVNEAALSAICGLQNGRIVFLPFSSYENAKLVASEYWNRIFYLNTDTLTLFPGAEKVEKVVSVDAEMLFELEERISVDEMVEASSDLSNDLSELDLPTSSWLLPGTVLRRLEELLDNDDLEGYVAPHLAMASKLSDFSDSRGDALLEWCGKERSLVELLTKMGRHED